MLSTLSTLFTLSMLYTFYRLYNLFTLYTLYSLHSLHSLDFLYSPYSALSILSSLSSLSALYTPYALYTEHFPFSTLYSTFYSNRLHSTHSSSYYKHSLSIFSATLHHLPALHFTLPHPTLHSTHFQLC